MPKNPTTWTYSCNGVQGMTGLSSDAVNELVLTLFSGSPASTYTTSGSLSPLASQFTVTDGTSTWAWTKD